MMWLLGTRLGRTVGAAAIAIALFGAWTAWNRYDAANDAVSRIEEINNGLSEKAINARDGRRMCVTAGGVWNFATSRCAENSG